MKPRYFCFAFLLLPALLVAQNTFERASGYAQATRFTDVAHLRNDAVVVSGNALDTSAASLSNMTQSSRAALTDRVTQSAFALTLRHVRQ